MAAPTPYTGPTPPDLPDMPGAGAALTGYLRRFSLWASDGLARKLETRSAAPGFLIYANDAAPGTTPAVFMLQVKTDGTVVAVPVAIASGRIA